MHPSDDRDEPVTPVVGPELFQESRTGKADTCVPAVGLDGVATGSAAAGMLNDHRAEAADVPPVDVDVAYQL